MFLLVSAGWREGERNWKGANFDGAEGRGGGDCEYEKCSRPVLLTLGFICAVIHRELIFILSQLLDFV